MVKKILIVIICLFFSSNLFAEFPKDFKTKKADRLETFQIDQYVIHIFKYKVENGYCYITVTYNIVFKDKQPSISTVFVPENSNIKMIYGE